MLKIIRLATILFFSITFLFAKDITEIIPTQELFKFDHYLNQGEFTNAKKFIKTRETTFSNRNVNMTQVYYLWSRYYYYLHKMDLFEKYAKMAYNRSKYTDLNQVKIYGIYAMAAYSKVQRDYKSTLRYIKEIERLVSVEDDLYLAYYVYYRYYSLYTSWEELDKTDYYTQKLIQVSKLAPNYHNLVDAYTARSFAMEYIYNANQSTAYKDSIRYYRERAAYLANAKPDKVGYPTKSIAYLNLADYYTEVMVNGRLPFEKVKDSIIKYTGLANEVPSIFDPHYGIRGNVLNLRASLYKEEGKYKEAEKMLLKAYSNLEQSNSGETPLYPLKNVSGALYDFYTSIGDYKNATVYLEKYIVHNDSIFNLNKINEINELEAKYETKRMQDKNEYLQNENKWNRTLNYFLITIFILTCIAIYFISKNNHKKIKLQKLKHIELLHEKEKVDAEVHNAKKEQAELTKNQELLLKEKERLSKEALVNNLKIDRNDKLLQEIQDHLKQDNGTQEVKKTLKRENKISQSIDNSVNEFSEIPPEFFEKLKIASNNKLTALDIRYCAYFYLGLATKEIATVFSVESKSVRMTKYRIKNKLNLPKEQSLESFLDEL